ncbi:MAG: DUF4824 family protein [Pseudomonadota bacterium]
MRQLTARRAFWLGAGLILLCNAVALGGVFYNRSGEPDSRLMLTEREFGTPHHMLSNQENSGLSLRLDWRLDSERVSDWLTAAKLRELGFRLGAAQETWPEQLSRQLQREVWLVLELDGPAYARALETARGALVEAEQAVRQAPGNSDLQANRDYRQLELEQEQSTATRLFLVDAGVDRPLLRQHYADRQRYALVRGRLKPYLYEYPAKPSHFSARIELDIDQINVPFALREPFLQWRGDKSPIRALIAFGQRHEPWMVNAERPR